MDKDKNFGPTNKVSQAIHAMKYRTKREDFRTAMYRIAGPLSDNEKHFHDLSEILLEQRFLPAGRIQSAIGSINQVTAFNCFVSDTIQDSAEGIMKTFTDSFMTQRQGGGIGYDFSTIRPSGNFISTLNAPASGPVSFMAIGDAVCGAVSSAGNRRGAQMAVLRIDHPDIEEFIVAKNNENNLTRYNMSLGVTDDFMKALKEGTPFALRWKGEPVRMVNAQALWDKIMRSTWDWAEPGILFIDTINHENNLNYCETIAATNPCLHPDSLIETVEGRVRIADIKEPTKVYTMLKDGSLGISNASASWVSKKDAQTLKISTRNGKTLEVTPNHEVFVHNKGWVEAGNLVLGDRIVQLCRARRGAAYSGVKLTTEDNRAYRMEHVMVADAVYGVGEGEDVHHLNGNTYDNFSDNLEVLSHSIHSTLTRYECENNHQVHDNAGRFINQPKKQKKIIPMPENLKSNMKNNFSNTVVSIEVGETTDVYDLSVEDTHNFIADFSVVHNCGEQPLPPNGACLLGSWNLTKYIIEVGGDYYFNYEQLKKDIPVVVRAMDNVIDVSTYPLPAQEQEAKAKRRMGLGYTGLANTLEVLGLPYATEGFLKAQEDLQEMIKVETYWAGVDLAREKGVFPLYKDEYLDSPFIKRLPEELQLAIRDFGIRNSHYLSLAPTGTISVTADNVSSSLEPVFAYSYERTIQLEDGPVTEDMVDYGYANWGVEGRKTSEISPKEHLAVLKCATEFSDSAVSKTCNIGDDVTWKEFKDVYVDAYEMGAKGVTTFRAAGKRFGILVDKDAEDSPEEAEEEATGQACYINPETGQSECG